MKAPKLMKGGVYFIPEHGSPKRLAIKGFVDGFPIRVSEKMWVYVDAKRAKQVLGK